MSAFFRSGIATPLALALTLTVSVITTAPRAAAQTTPGAAASSDPVTVKTPASAPALAASIPPGTTITAQNWTQYKDFMPNGMVGFFAGTYPWKMPSDVQMVVGPTIIHPLPKGYVEATEKYSSQVRIVELADDGLTLANYQGGTPFPNPAEPHKGWKILANLWYRYLPHLIVDTYAHGCGVTSGGDINCKSAQIVTRQLSFNTDPGTPATFHGAEGKFSTEWFMVLEPEQSRYTATLTIAHTDPALPEDLYVFLPSLRRYQPVSTAARCSPEEGTDSNQEDYRFGYNSNIAEAQVQYLGEKKILSMMGYTMPQEGFPGAFDMPLGWPKPTWGKWQVRDVYVISVSKIPSRAKGYCYGKRVMYVDKATYAPIWEDLYDSNMKPWRILGLFLRTINVPGIGPQDDAGSLIWAFWDVQNQHASFFIDPAPGHDFYVNSEAPHDYDDLTRYSSAPGLNLIMR
jgi:hypothetical protein